MRHHRQPVVEILAEAARPHLLRQVAVGGRDRPARPPAIGRLEPTRSMVFSCSTRSSLTCISGGRSPTSSRSSVPPPAASKRPVRLRSAPVKAPFSWPNSSLSSRVVRERAAVHGDEGHLRPAGRRRGSRARPAPCRCRSRRSAAPGPSTPPRGRPSRAARTWRRRRSRCRGSTRSRPAGASARGSPAAGGAPASPCRTRCSTSSRSSGLSR